MATTDARTGFRLPWSTDQRPTDGSVDGDDITAEGSVGPEADLADQPAETDSMTEAVDLKSDAPMSSAPTASPSGSTATGVKRPSKFMADLTKAMQVAAETAREETLARLQADAKAHVEDIHTRSATEAADLRRRADDDVAAVREWSKAEIARIRDETESRIGARKGRLETEIDDHAALIERQIERVKARVSAFESDMAAWFERLLAEEDPSRFAAMAGSLPEPEPFDANLGADDVLEAPERSEAHDTRATWPGGAAAESTDPEATMAAIQAAAEAAASSQLDAPESPTTTADPRVAALGLSSDFEAAEMEAFAAAENGEESEIPTIADADLAARLAGLVPEEDIVPAQQVPSTQVVVMGLVSVASIASFKRHLGRLPGVQSVGVSSGPDGEFLFTVAHGEGVSIRDAVPSLPGFQARVTGGSGHVVEVAAKDPENEA